MSLSNSLRTASAHLQAEIETLAADNLPGKEELLRNMNAALRAVHEGLEIQKSILDGKESAPALLRKIRLLSRLLTEISADCRKFLAGGG